MKDPSEAIRIMQTAVDEGLTFFDNCWDYHDGGSEEVMGRALAGGRRDKVFLMTKNCERDYAGSMKCLTTACGGFRRTGSTSGSFTKSSMTTIRTGSSKRVA